MRNHPNEDRICDVVQDLLPLYLEGDCAPGSVALVEEHLKTCAGCREKYHLMRTPLAGVEGVPEPSAENMTAKRAFQKVRRRMKLVICVFLAILLAIPVGILLSRELTGRGACLSNWGARQLGNTLIESWKQEGSAAMVEQLEPKMLYEERATPWSDYRVNSSYGMLQYYSDGYEADENWIEVELLGETYCVSGFERWAQDTSELYDQESLELRELYQGGHALGVLHRLVRDQPEQVVLSESAYQALMVEFGDLDAERYVAMSRNSGVYYIYCGPEGSTGQDTAMEVQLDYPADFWVVLKQLEPIDPVYAMLHKNAAVMPKELFQECLDSSEEIRQNFEDYALYYTSLGYETFADRWRQQLSELLEACPLQLLSYYRDDIMSINMGAGNQNGERHHTWQIQWGVNFGGQPATVRFLVQDSRCCQLESLYFRGEVSQELQSWSQELETLLS